MVQSRRNSQRWILDRLVGAMGLDALFPGFTGLSTSPVIGYNTADLDQIKRETDGLGTLRHAFVRAAQRREAIAHEAEEADHTVTARRHFHLAALYYAAARYMIQEDGSQLKAEFNEKAGACYGKVIELAATPIERVEIPFDDDPPYGADSFPGLLHLPAGEGPFPCVIFLPGTDMYKEQVPNPEDNIFAKRGLACLSIDGPGQGESLLRMLKVHVETENYERAVSAALDYLESRSEIDSTRLGVIGASTGSYWAARAAVHEATGKSRLQAAAGLHAQWETGFVAEFEYSQPNFKTNYMYMAGIEDEEEFDRQAALHTLDGLVSKARCPILIVQGEFDEVCTPEQVEGIMCQMTQPHELRIYESEFHPLGNVAIEAYEKSIDWVKDHLEGAGERSGIVRVIADGVTRETRPTQHPEQAT